METKRISAKQLRDMGFYYTVQVKPKVESPIIFEFVQWVEKELKSPSKKSPKAN